MKAVTIGAILLVIASLVSGESYYMIEPDDLKFCKTCTSGPMCFVVYPGRQIGECRAFPLLNQLTVVEHYYLHPEDCGQTYTPGLYTAKSMTHFKPGTLSVSPAEDYTLLNHFGQVETLGNNQTDVLGSVNEQALSTVGAEHSLILGKNSHDASLSQGEEDTAPEESMREFITTPLIDETYIMAVLSALRIHAYFDFP